MPIYLSTKRLLSIPHDSESEISDSEFYLDDPDMLFDRLPQPYRLINKIVNRICNDSWSLIKENAAMRYAKSLEVPIESIRCSDEINNIPNVLCMQCLDPTGSVVVIGFINGILLYDISQKYVIDRWDVDEMNTTSIKCAKFFDNTYIILTLDDSGSGRLLMVTCGRMYLLKLFSSKDSDKPIQVTALYVDNSCNFLGVSFDQFKENEQWMDVYKVNKEAWLKELETIGRSLGDYSNNPPRTAQTGSLTGRETASDSTSMLDRTGIRVTPIVLQMKIKFPFSLGTPGLANFQQLQKQIDSTGQVIGVGLNHLFSNDFYDQKLMEFEKENAESIPYLSKNDMDYQILRMANVRFCSDASALINVQTQIDGQDKVSCYAFVWWTQYQHLFIYDLNRQTTTKGGENLVKPDGVRTFSSSISICEISPNETFLAIGLTNGNVILIDVKAGITRISKKIFDTTVDSIAFSMAFLTKQKLIIFLSDKNGKICKIFYDFQTLDHSIVSVVDPSIIHGVTMFNQTEVLLTAYRDGHLQISNLLLNLTANLELPEGISVSSWDIVSDLFVNIKLFCIKGTRTDSEHSDEVTEKSVLLLYPTGYCLDEQDGVVEIPLHPEINSPCAAVNNIVADLLSDWYSLHEERQKDLQTCWNNLNGYLTATFATPLAT